MRLVFALVLLLSASMSKAALPMHERVIALYSFSPAELDAKAKAAKSEQLDKFWSETKAGGPAALAELRTELASNDAPAFFSYDGAKLLLSLSKAGPDEQLALDAVARTNLKDIDRTDYFLTVHRFAVDGLDTTQAAFKILGDPDFKIFIAVHYLELPQEFCLSLMLLPTREDYYLDKARQRLAIEKDVTAQKSLLTLLAATVTASGDEAIATFAASPTAPALSREHAQMLLKSNTSRESSFSLGAPGSYAALKEQQRKLLANVSDETLDQWVYHLQPRIRRAYAHERKKH